MMAGLFTNTDGLLWLLLMIVPLVVLQRLLHREIQAVVLILSRRVGVTQVIFAILFFPGVFLHELSHFLMAKLLGVQTGRFSLIPHSMPDGRLQLGAVETASGGVVRDALVGAAPLISGCIFVGFTAIFPMHLLPLWDFLRSGDWGSFWGGIALLPALPDFWLWFYLTFTVSSTMLPSASDRHAWLPSGLIVGALISVALLAGAGQWMLVNLAPPINSFLRALALIFGWSAGLHAILVLPVFLLHQLMAKLTGIDVAA
jgi:hypothetical protein